jgi:diguanylate cyclase (GGDEF)-like protein
LLRVLPEEPIAMTETWETVLRCLRFAFQPIATSSDGRAYGYEALLRGWSEAGFHGIASVFDCAYLEGCLLDLDLRLRAKAFADFAAWAPAGSKIFYNVDNRIFQSTDDAMGDTARIAGGLGLSASRVVLEISERHELEGDRGFEGAISRCREAGFRIAIDDFGSGYAGLKLLQMSEPDIIKIDRHFVAGSGAEPRKAAFLEKIVGMAHLMGVPVVAEGVETEAELGVCVEAGCDMIQGFLLARPLCGQGGFEASFPLLALSRAEARRGRSASSPIPASSLRLVEPVLGSKRFIEVLGRFRKEPELDILPVVDSSGEPVGVYLERDFRQYVYSPYGISILEHLGSEAGASSFLRKAPIAASSGDLVRVLEVFGSLPASGGVILTQDSRYAGLLPAAELLSLVAERELSEARDQNPLTRLPGNLRVAELIAERMSETARGRAFIYFDFDDFKPFNDRYGFRLGDRVIQLFADILRSVFARSGDFVGHLGGDDYFAFSYASSLSEAMVPVEAASSRFRHEAVSFYSAEDRERGWILGRDRSGEERKMPLIGVSAALVFTSPEVGLDAESLSDLFAALKKEAKRSASHTAYQVIDAPGGEKADKPGLGSVMSPAFAVFAPKLRAC